MIRNILKIVMVHVCFTVHSIALVRVENRFIGDVP